MAVPSWICAELRMLRKQIGVMKKETCKVTPVILHLDNLVPAPSAPPGKFVHVAAPPGVLLPDMGGNVKKNATDVETSDSSPHQFHAPVGLEVEVENDATESGNKLSVAETHDIGTDTSDFSPCAVDIEDAKIASTLSPDDVKTIVSISSKVCTQIIDRVSPALAQTSVKCIVGLMDEHDAKMLHKLNELNEYVDTLLLIIESELRRKHGIDLDLQEKCGDWMMR